MVEIASLKERDSLKNQASREAEYAYQERQGVVPRNGLGQPQIWLPDGSRRVSYGRPSGAGSVLDDKENLFPWQRGRVAIGASQDDRPLQKLRDFAYRGGDFDSPDGKDLAKLAGTELFKVGGGEDKADRGTILHDLTELIDLGAKVEDLGFIPEQYVPLLNAYADAMSAAADEFDLRVVATELFGVNDHLRLAGTMDRVLWFKAPGWESARLIIGDGKSSGSLEYSMGKFAMQIHAYSGMSQYDPAAALAKVDDHGLGVGREPLAVDQDCEPIQVDRSLGLVIWFRSGGNRVEIVPIPLEEAAVGFELAAGIKEWRNMWKRKAYQPKALLAREYDIPF